MTKKIRTPDARTVNPGQPVSYHNEPDRPPAIVGIRHEGARPTHEVRDLPGGFHHRVSLGEITGAWVGYQSIAVLKVGSVVYHACTDYYHGTLPINVVFVTKELK